MARSEMLPSTGATLSFEFEPSWTWLSELARTPKSLNLCSKFTRFKTCEAA